MARRCGVCGFRSDKPVCPQCNTVLLKGRAVCPSCGTMFSGWVAACDTCGRSLGPQPPPVADGDAIRALAAIPGISDDRARELVMRGFRDFSDLVRLALPERAVRQGLHHAIARKAILSDLVAKPKRTVDNGRCPMCGAAWLAGATRCAACGSLPDLELDPSVVEQKLQEITGEIVDLATDEDFQSMPEDARNELVRAFGGLNETDVIRQQYNHQIEAWRSKDFDVEPLERLLNEDLVHFRERSTRLIRAQVMKKAEAGKYRCPLCEVVLPSTAEECENCGARFS
ncbi:MAG TPA: hypothetical protein VJP06_03215 [Thermoplasmata archaeon]|nr:hypothetical protein [Thermoplasmata archaeon]